MPEEKKDQAAMIRGTEILHQVLLDEGVEVIFGIPGGQVLPVFDQFYNSPINLVLCRHEQGAAHAADGYARASGRVGVVFATSGPGATNIVTGLATAYMDSVPVVAVTGQVRTQVIGNDAFQEADMTGITRPITKHNALVRNVADLGRTLKEAFHIARTGRPGPVLVDLPVDVSTAYIKKPVDMTPRLPGYKPRHEGHLRQIQLAAKMINDSERPVVYAGGGVVAAEASALLRELAHKANIPVTMTLLGLGTFPSREPLALGMLGMHGTAYANYAVQNCDCLIAVGARFDDRVTGKLDHFAKKAKVIHIDIDPTSIAKNVAVDLPVVGDAKAILTELVKLVEFRPREAWLNQIAEWKQKFPLRYEHDNTGIKPQFVIEQICEATRGEAIVATGVGQHQMWTAQFFDWRFPRQIITSGGLGTMGFGLPAAIGAAFAKPDSVVFDMDGDGSFVMTMSELCTAVKHRLNVKVAIFNNTYLGMVRQWQEMFYGRRYSASVNFNPDFPLVAQAMGAKGMRVDKDEEVRPAIEEALRTEGPVVMDFHVSPEENVYPMIAPGKALHEMELGTLA